MGAQPDEALDVATALRRAHEVNRRLAAENARLTTALEAAKTATSSKTIIGLSDWLISSDADGRIVYLNSSAEAHFKVPREKAIGQPLTSLSSPIIDGNVLEAMAVEASHAQHTLNREISSQDPETGEDRSHLLTVALGPSGIQFLVSDRSHLKRLENTLQRYMSPTVIEAVLNAGVDPFKAQKYDLTVLFVDLRGFTAVSSQLPAEEVKKLIDEYLTVQIDVVLDSGATLDKIVGDEVMALFGAPLPVEDHALWAINTALKMREGHRRLAEHWQRRGFVGCPIGIGINTGEMVVGNIGSHRRMQYTVLGHNVNLGARLCSAALPGDILISPKTYEQARKSLTEDPSRAWRAFKFVRGPVVQAKGITEPVETVLVIDTK